VVPTGTTVTFALLLTPVEVAYVCSLALVAPVVVAVVPETTPNGEVWRQPVVELSCGGGGGHA